MFRKSRGSKSVSGRPFDAERLVQRRADETQKARSPSPPARSNHGNQPAHAVKVEIEPNDLTILPVAMDQKQEVDICFVHGLNGSSANTWRYKETDFFWPLQLSRDLEFCRVMLFGYDTIVEPSLGSNQIRLASIANKMLEDLVNNRLENDEISRPLILIGHSLGGLVIKKALVESSRNSRNGRGEILNSMAAILFFGTPNAGSTMDKRKRIQLLKAIVTVAFTELPPKIELLLQSHSDELLDLADQFRDLEICRSGKLTVYSYFEGHDFGGVGERIVDEYSARVMVSDEVALPIQADHIAMVKFKSTTDGDYKSVSKTIKRLAKKAARMDQSSQLSVPHTVDRSVAESKRFELMTPQSRSVDLYRQVPNEEEWEVIMDNISLYDHERAHDTISRKRSPDTGWWLFEHSEIQSLLQGKSDKNIWCYGNVGMGKSVLASSIVEYTQYSDLGGVGFFGYYYCDVPATDSTTSIQILESLTKQLLLYLHTPATIPHDTQIRMKRLYCRNTAERDSYNVQKILLQLLQLAKNPLFLLDGLDYLDNNCAAEILTTFRLIVSKMPTFRILLISRPQIVPNLRVESYLKPVTTIDLNEVQSREDVAAFIKHRLAERAYESSPLTDDPEKIEWLQKELVDRAEGMMLWAWFKIEELWIYGKSWEEARNCVVSFPSKMDEIYERCLERIQDQGNADIAIAAFRWIACASRPLSLEELAEAISIDDQDDRYQEDKAISCDRLISSCANLIELDNVDQVRYVHQSIRQYLLSSPSLTQFKVTYQEAKLECGKTCITYLNFTDFQLRVAEVKERSTAVPPDLLSTGIAEQLRLNPTIAKLIFGGKKMTEDQKHVIRQRLIRRPNVDKSRYKFLPYASQYWVVDCRWISRSSPLWSKFGDLTMQPNASYGFHPWKTLNFAPTSYFHCIFAWAVRNNHVPLIDLLEERMPRNDFETFFSLPLVAAGNDEMDIPLCVAIKLGHVDMVIRLLKIPSATRADKRQRLPIHYVALHGGPGMASILASLKADVDARDQNNTTALHFAAASGNVSAVTSLTGFGARKNLEAVGDDGYSWLPFQIAVKNGYDDAASHLYDDSIVPELRFPDGSQLLFWIARFGMAATLDRLLGSNKPLNTRLENSLLHIWGAETYEILSRHLEISEAPLLGTLLQDGPIVSKEQFLGDILQRGFYHTGPKQNRKTLTLIKQHQAGQSESSKQQLIALFFFAILSRKLRVLQVFSLSLAKAPVYPSQLRGKYRTLSSLLTFGIVVAALAGDSVGVEMLMRVLAAIPDIKSVDMGPQYNYHTPLTWAASEGRIQAINPLLSNGYSIAEKNKEGFNAVQVAVLEKRTEFLRELLSNSQISSLERETALEERTIDCSRFSKFFTYATRNDAAFTALHLAVCSFSIEGASCLVAHGADIHALTYLGKSALHIAACNTHTTMIELLCAAGAKIHSQDRFGKTPLNYAKTRTTQVNSIDYDISAAICLIRLGKSQQ